MMKAKADLHQRESRGNPMADYGGSLISTMNYDGLLNLISSAGTKMVFAKNEFIFQNGEIPSDLYYIAEGEVAVVTSNENGAEKVIMVLKSHTFSGGIYRVSKIPYALSIIARTPTVVYRIDQNNYDRLMSESKLFRDAFVLCAEKKLELLLTEVANLSFNTSKERLFAFLSNLATEKAPSEGEEWWKITTRHTQEEMAKAVGASKYTIWRLIGELCDEDKTKIVNRKIYVKKQVKMEQ